MSKGIIDFVKEISNKIEEKIIVYKNDGKPFLGQGEDIDNISFDKVIFDEINNRTLFKAEYCGEGYILSLDGSDSKNKAIALLVANMLEHGNLLDDNLSKEDFYKNVIYGKYSYYEISEYVKQYNIDERLSCSMIINNLAERTDEVCEVLHNYLNEEYDIIIKLANDKIALIKVVDDAVEEYRSVSEYAEFLYQSINEETGVHVGIYLGSEIKNTTDVSESFSQAFLAESMGNLTQLNGHVHSYKEYVFVKMIEDLPKYKLQEYLNILMDSSANEIFEDNEMLLTAEEFLDNNLNISETSRKLYLHRNTLTYRLDKIEKATGLDLKKFSDALTFRIIVILKKLVK